jgi:hypothetical protein
MNVFVLITEEYKEYYGTYKEVVGVAFSLDVVKEWLDSQPFNYNINYMFEEYAPYEIGEMGELIKGKFISDGFSKKTKY